MDTPLLCSGNFYFGSLLDEFSEVFVFPCSLTGFLENHVVTGLISFNVYEGGGTLLLPLQLAPLAIAVVLILTTPSPLFPWD